MPIRLIATDIDHTLLTSQRIPHPESVLAIKRAVASGVHVVLASGRYIPSIKGYGRDIGLIGPFIGCNGAHICDTQGVDLSVMALDKEVTKHLLSYAQQHRVHINVYTDQSLYLCSNDRPAGQISADQSGTIKLETIRFEDALNLTVIKIMLIDEPDAVIHHQRHLTPQFRPDQTHVTTSEPEYLEFLPFNSNKGLALQKLADHLGIHQSETAAIGDYMNDLEMIKWAGIGAAVGNATSALKDAANVVVKSNDEGGVGEFIDSLIQNQRK